MQARQSTQSVTASALCHEVSCVPGRVRWELPGAADWDAGAWHELERRVTALHGVRSARANPGTLRLLVLFEGEGLFEAVQGLVRQSVTEEAVCAPEPAPLDAAGMAWCAASVAAATGVAVACGLAWVPACLFGVAAGACTAVAATALREQDGALRMDDIQHEQLIEFGRELLPHRRALARAAGLSGAAVLANAGRMAAMGLAVNAITSETPLVLFGVTFGATGALLLFVGASIALTAAFAITRYRSDAICWAAGRETQHQLRTALYDQVQHLRLADFQEQTRGELTSVITEDIDQIERAFDAGAVFLYLTLNTTILLGGIVLVAPRLGLFAGSFIGLLILESLASRNRIRQSYDRVRREGGQLSQQVSTSLEGLTTVRSYTAELGELRRVERASSKYRDTSLGLIPGAVGLPLVLEGTVLVGLSLAVMLGGPLLGLAQLSAGGYIALIMLMGQVFYRFLALGPTLDNLARGLTSYRKVREVLQLGRDDDPPVTLALPEIRGEISYDNVSFAYVEGTEVLRGLSLRIEPGKTTAIVGLTGSGKSTILNLLLGFYPLRSGSISVDGVDIRRLRKAEYRSAIAVVSQDVYLFHRSIRDNIALGNPHASPEEIVQATTRAGAHAFIEQLPEGYATIVGERGDTLSGGQRQRIGIARALLKNAPVLVLDEGTSHLDLETESSVLGNLADICKDKTVIVIAHRLSTIRKADQIYVLQNGQLEEQGSHEELLQGTGTYRQLWQYM